VSCGFVVRWLQSASSWSSINVIARIYPHRRRCKSLIRRDRFNKGRKLHS
jgi:hypothetical protein